MMVWESDKDKGHLSSLSLLSCTFLISSYLYEKMKCFIFTLTFFHFPLMDLLSRILLVSWGKSLLIQLCGCVCASPKGHHLLMLPVACLPASHYRGDTRPSSPFNTAPAANIDWFSPTVGAQLSPSLLHLLALCTDCGKVRSRKVYRSNRECE